MWKRGEVAGYQLPSGTVIVKQPEQDNRVTRKVAIYARVSASENKKNWETQAERLLVWCTIQGWSVHQVVKEGGSGINFQCPRFLALLADPTISHSVMEHQDRASRFGIASLQMLLAVQGRELVMVTTAQTAEEDLMSMITSFVARLSGRKWGKHKTEQVLAALQQNGSEGSEPKARQG